MKNLLNLLFLSFLFMAPITASGQVFTAPYFNDFETGAPGWVAISDSNSQWELGLPSFGTTNSAYSGNNCWDISLQSAYLNASNCYLQSPAFNFSNLSSLEISFWQNRNTELYWDGMTLLYTTDTLQPWSVLGSMGVTGAINWYNDSSLNANSLPGWAGTSGGWIKSTIVIPNFFGNSDVWFRFRFSSDNSVTLDGISVDDFKIEETELNSITGTVYIDVNQNNIYDVGDLPYPGIQLTSTNGSIIEVQPSDNNGNYYFIADSGSTFTVSADAPMYAVVNPVNHSVIFNGSNQISSANNFLVTFLPDIIDVGVDVYQSTVRPGLNTTSYINFYKQGTTVTSGTITLEYDPAFTSLNASQSALPVAVNTLEFTYSNLLPGQSEIITANFLVNTNLALGSVTNVSCIIYPLTGDTLISNNYDSAMQVAVNSYDPNNKLIDPEGDLPIQQVISGIDLHYTINFQNTGTATAFHVNLYDALSENLNLLTFQITSSSHNFTNWSIDANRILHFEFANINLPDSFSNEPGSHGFVRYKIRPLTTLSVGQIIDNQAAIYFDNNSPILTNITSSVVVDPTGVNDLITDNLKNLFIFPNPTTGKVFIKTTADHKNFTVLNSIGEEVISGLIFSPGTLIEIDLGNVTSGLYLLIVDGENSKHYTKIIVK